MNLVFILLSSLDVSMCIILPGVSIHNFWKNITNKICHFMDCFIFISEQREWNIFNNLDKVYLFAFGEYYTFRNILVPIKIVYSTF